MGAFGGRSRSPSRRLLATAAFLSVLIGAASAQGALTDPPPLDPSNPKATTDDLQNTPQENPETIPDTWATPIAEEESPDWKQIGGALYPKAEGDDPAALVEGSPTAYADNLFDIDFAHSRLGIAAGANCPAEGDSHPDADRDPEGPPACYPVAYLFRESDEDGETWSPLPLPGAERPGYVGAVAWLDANTAMAVGGTGTFPRREPPYGKEIDGSSCETVTEESLKPWAWNCDQAGDARAWLIDANRGRVCELGQSPECPALPTGRDGELAHGLTAIDFRPATESDPTLGFAGGLGQIFAWHGGQNGSFDPLGPAGPGGSVDNHSPGAQGGQPTAGGELWQQSPGRLFRFRVREIRFAPIVRVRAYVVTSGCCSPSESTDRPLMLTYSDYNGSSNIPAQWFLHQYGGSGVDGYKAPESLYSLVTTAFGSSAPAAVLATSASTDSALERRSEVWGCQPISDSGGAPSRTQSGIVTGHGLSTARMVAIDGWAMPGRTGRTGLSECVAMPEWAVGELRSERAPGHGRRGLVSQSKTPQRQVPPVDSSVPTPDEVLNGWEPTSEDRLRRSLATLESLTTSYTLNSVGLIEEAGEAWAVGDHGALLRLGSDGAGSGSVNETEPTPPRLGSKARRELPERGAYETPAPAKSAAALPALGARPAQALDEPELVGMGSPDITHFPFGSAETEDVGQIVMSRDGSEGWAIGPNHRGHFGVSSYGTASFYHYDGTAWTRCDPRGIAGQLAPDLACASLAGLKRWLDPSKNAITTKIVSATRVPLENDDVPANDDEFEVVAIGTEYMGEPKRHLDGTPIVLRYSNGAWDFEEPEVRKDISFLDLNKSLVLKDVAFTAPDDGWILANDWYSDPGAGPGEPVSKNRLFYFDGTSWTHCSLGRQATGGDSECGSDRIPLSRVDHMLGGLRLLAAGERVYIFGARAMNSFTVPPDTRIPLSFAPLIIYHERGKPGWTDGQGDDEAGGGYDPGWNNPAPGVSGTVHSLAVNQNADGSYSGWAQVRLYDHEAPDVPHPLSGVSGGQSTLPLAALLMRLEPGAREWQKFHDRGALADYMAPQQLNPSSYRHRTEPHLQTLTSGSDGSELAVIAQRQSGRIFSFDEGRQQWRIISSELPSRTVRGEEGVHGQYQALAPDNQGGFWAAVKNPDDNANGWAGSGQVFFSHYTASPPQEIFTETPQPFGDKNIRITGLAGAPDGSLWATTDSSTVARYERASGWQTAQIPGWDPGIVIIRSSEVNAVAAGPGGEAVAVGRGGRIANLTPGGIRLDDAASVHCEGTGLGEGCGTSRELRAVSVSPEGAALAGGDMMALLWRPDAETPFARISPPLSDRNDITGISMPTSTSAWITTDTGLVLAGELSSSETWSWKTENRVNAPGSPFHERILGSVTQGNNLALRAIAIDASGHGYAVGDQGLVLERTGDSQPWRRLRGPGTDHLTAVTLGQADGQGAMIGGRNGVVWTAQGSKIQLARPADYARDGRSDSPFNGPTTGPVAGMALLPGYADGQTEAWVAIQERGPGTNRLLHYTNAPEEPLLDPGADAAPLADAPPERAGELRIAAYGKSDCLSLGFCTPMIGSGESSEVAVARIAEAVEDDDADLALFTGDATDSTGAHAMSAANYDELGDPLWDTAVVDQVGQIGHYVQPRTIGPRTHRRFAEFGIEPLEDAGIPMLGAIGPGDLSRAWYEKGRGTAFDEPAKTGENLAWREGLASEPGPWGTGDEFAGEGETELTEASESDGLAVALPEATVDAETEVEVVRPVEAKNGARTHYAADLIRNGEEAARIVVVDSSLRGLAAADPIQNPVEIDGQLGFLERMLCFRGQSAPTGGRCTRERDQEAIVLSNTPTYSYGPVDPTALATDGAALESLYLRYEVSLVVSGRLGWNGLYYALAPGLHTPCPGGGYPEHPPKPGAALCDSVASMLPLGGAPDPERAVSEAGGPSVSELLDTTGDVRGIVPFVVASGAGGKFGPNREHESGSAADGFWHGYTLVRLAADGDPRALIVEQRPILDTLAIEANEHVVGAGEKIALRGIGREPIAISHATGSSAARYNEIISQAITHRYDLLLADPDEPWLPCEASDEACVQLAARLAGPRSFGSAAAEGSRPANACEPYLCLPTRVGTIDPTTGEVRAGDGRYPDTQAIALLSVGERSATYPLVFTKSPSFVVQPLQLTAPLPAPPSVAPNPPQPPQPPNPPQPNVPNPTVPDVPPPPPVPPLAASQPPEPQPPAPPAPPPPAEQLSPLSLTLAPPGLAIATPTAVIQPPTPPVNPAPPGGARREARQRQAAAQKSGADNEESEAGDSRGDQAQDLPGTGGAAFTRHDHSFTRRTPAEARGAREPSFTALSRADDGTTGTALLYTGGITLLALAAAMGWTWGRPTPRRRTPEVPAPARAWAGQRRR